MWGPPSNSGKWRFVGILYWKCNSPGGDCYWEGATNSICKDAHTTSCLEVLAPKSAYEAKGCIVPKLESFRPLSCSKWSQSYHRKETIAATPPPASILSLSPPSRSQQPTLLNLLRVGAWTPKQQRFRKELQRGSQDGPAPNLQSLFVLRWEMGKSDNDLY